jgi:hypothetical protein
MSKVVCPRCLSLPAACPPLPAQGASLNASRCLSPFACPQVVCPPLPPAACLRCLPTSCVSPLPPLPCVSPRCLSPPPLPVPPIFAEQRGVSPFFLRLRICFRAPPTRNCYIPAFPICNCERPPLQKSRIPINREPSRGGATSTLNGGWALGIGCLSLPRWAVMLAAVEPL